MGKGRPQKYNRVSCQQKYMLRRLIVKEKMSVKQAADNLGINYSTAKTIMFCFRQSAPTPHSSFSHTICMPKNSIYLVASYIQVPSAKPISIITSVGGGVWMKADQHQHQSTDQHKQVKLECSF